MDYTQVINFVKESLNRIRTKAPKFFFILQIIGLSFLFAGQIPKALDRWTNIKASEKFINFCNDISKGSIGFLLSTLFASQGKTLAKTEEGEIVGKVPKDQFPFTTEAASRKAEKEGDLPVIENMPNK